MNVALVVSAALAGLALLALVVRSGRRPKGKVKDSRAETYSRRERESRLARRVATAFLLASPVLWMSKVWQAEVAQHLPSDADFDARMALAKVLGTAAVATLLAGATAAVVSSRGRPTPTRAELDAREPDFWHAQAFALALCAFLACFALWWFHPKNDALDELLFKVETWRLIWTLSMTPAERTQFVVMATAWAAAVVLGILLVRALVIGTAFPLLLRLNEKEHRGGAPETLGRLYAVVPFTESAETATQTFRLYYKSRSRLFPLLVFDTLDVDARPRWWSIGQQVIHCGRVELDVTSGKRGRHITRQEPLPAYPLKTRFRDDVEEEDRERKLSIATSGALQNVDIARSVALQRPSRSPLVRAIERTLRNERRAASEARHAARRGAETRTPPVRGEEG